jgi:hypothetical protein
MPLDHVRIPGIEPDIADESFSAKFAGHSRRFEVLVMNVYPRNLILYDHAFHFPFVKDEGRAISRKRRLGNGNVDAVEGILIQGSSLFFRYNVEEGRGQEFNILREFNIVFPCPDR